MSENEHFQNHSKNSSELVRESLEKNTVEIYVKSEKSAPMTSNSFSFRIMLCQI